MGRRRLGPVLDNVRRRGSKSNSHVHHVGNVLLAVQQARGTESMRVRGLYARGLGATGALASFGMDVQVLRRMWKRSGDAASGVRRRQRALLQSRGEAGNGEAMLCKGGELRRRQVVRWSMDTLFRVLRSGRPISRSPLRGKDEQGIHGVAVERL